MLNISETEEYNELQGVLDVRGLDISELNAALDELFSMFTADPNYEKSFEGYKTYILTDTLIDCLQYGIQCGIGEYTVVEIEEILTGELFSRYLEVYFNSEFADDLININEDYIKALKDEYISEYFEYFRYNREKSRYDNEFELFKRITEGYNFYSYRDENDGSIVIPWVYTTYHGRENYYDAFGVSLSGYVGIMVDAYINSNYEIFISDEYR